MEIEMNSFNELEIKLLINGLLTEKERYKQEKLAQKIQRMKDERTGFYVADLLYSDDAYIRNIAIEVLAALDEKALPAIKEKLLDDDRNIRKFAVDALKYIDGKNSCEIAVAALIDPDENVVEAALDVIAERKYRDADDTLRAVLKNTSSVWILNTLLKAFACLEVNGISEVLREKIDSISASDLEKNLLMNTYVMTLGSIGKYSDVGLILYEYSKDYIIDNSNLVFALCSLINRSDVSIISDDITGDLEKFLKERWEYKDSSHLLISIAAIVKLQFDFFLNDIRAMFDYYKSEEFFRENLFELINQLKKIPTSFFDEIFASAERELNILGLMLVHSKKIDGFNGVVEVLCNKGDKEISQLAYCIIADVDSYKNILLTEGSEFREVAEITSIEPSPEIESEEAAMLLLRLEHHSSKVRRAAAEKLVSLSGYVNMELLEELVRRSQGSDGIEALEVLYRLDTSAAMIYFVSKMDSSDDSLRAGLVNILDYSEDSDYYGFIKTMVNDPSSFVRKRTIKSLYKRKDERSFNLLKKLYADDTDIANKMEIISGLYMFDCDGVIDTIRHASGSSNILIRLAAVKALSFLHSNEAIYLLQGMLNDKIDEVRDAAVDALRHEEVSK